MTAISSGPRKLIKQIGLELAEDPELAPLILEPLNMQGVEQSAISRSRFG
jgi:hypothetical protein